MLCVNHTVSSYVVLVTSSTIVTSRNTNKCFPFAYVCTAFPCTPGQENTRGKSLSVVLLLVLMALLLSLCKLLCYVHVAGQRDAAVSCRVSLHEVYFTSARVHWTIKHSVEHQTCLAH